MCLFVRLSVREHTKFLCILPIAVARSFSGGVSIRYVLPVICIGNESVPKIIINNTFVLELQSAF